MCDLQDSQLAKVSSFTAHADLWDASRRLGVNLWAGLQAANNSSQLVMTWTDGSHLEATDQNFWVDGQPSLAPNTTQCMYINGGIPRRLKSWQLGDCNSLNGYTCQKPPGECQDGWLTHQSTCFKLFDDMQSWSVANLTCTGIGGQLVNLASPSDQMFLQRYLPVFASEYVDSIWIGLNDNGNDYGPITWSGGKNIGNATHWAENPPPNNTVGNLDCGFIDTSDSEGRWQLTSDCTVIRSWVCTIPVNTPVQPMPTSVSPYMCDPMWIQFGLSCYFFSDGPEIWSDARRMCKSFEADLVVITGDRDQAFLNRHVTGGDFWIGLHDIIVEGTWLWVNNNQARERVLWLLARYFHWATGEPNSDGNEDCVAIWVTCPSQNGLWNDYDCSKRYNTSARRRRTIMKILSLRDSDMSVVTVVRCKCGEFWEERPGSDSATSSTVRCKTTQRAARAAATTAASSASATRWSRATSQVNRIMKEAIRLRCHDDEDISMHDFNCDKVRFICKKSGTPASRAHCSLHSLLLGSFTTRDTNIVTWMSMALE
ncbi:hypothetical protein C0Q70_04343 [Pomacea canaliculata]|uniref:C-type lectin domain-containing protein n=1 Tax=Pomacea canaliculata TaxID=400727 RepID=A0A2T7PV89_POMCA|nr:hypothetical protein C0Q70_04343 [Pomacea canaliculata]